MLSCCPPSLLLSVKLHRLKHVLLLLMYYSNTGVCTAFDHCLLQAKEMEHLIRLLRLDANKVCRNLQFTAVFVLKIHKICVQQNLLIITKCHSWLISYFCY